MPQVITISSGIHLTDHTQGAVRYSNFEKETSPFKSRPTPFAADSGYAAFSRARFGRKGAIIQASLARPAAAAKPFRWAAFTTRR